MFMFPQLSSVTRWIEPRIDGQSVAYVVGSEGFTFKILEQIR